MRLPRIDDLGQLAPIDDRLADDVRTLVRDRCDDADLILTMLGLEEK